MEMHLTINPSKTKMLLLSMTANLGVAVCSAWCILLKEQVHSLVVFQIWS